MPFSLETAKRPYSSQAVCDAKEWGLQSGEAGPFLFLIWVLGCWPVGPAT